MFSILPEIGFPSCFLIADLVILPSNSWPLSLAYSVSAPVGGVIKRVLVHTNDSISQGDLIAEIGV